MNKKFEKGEMSLEKAVFFALREFIYAVAGVHFLSTERVQSRYILKQLGLEPWASSEEEIPTTWFRRSDDSVKDFINKHEFVKKVCKILTIDPSLYVPMIVEYLGSSSYRSAWLGGSHHCEWYKTYKNVAKVINSLIQ
jgi:hypothetical protein